MRYHNITKDDMLNGDGLRAVLWISGCPHACQGCHNPITWDITSGIEFDEEAKKEVFEELNKDYISGVTLSGGDPLHPDNREEVGLLVKEIKEKFPQKTIWLYTGYTWEEMQDLPFLDQLDIVVDGKFEEHLKDESKHWKGSTNQRVIEVKETLALQEIVLHD